MPRLLILLTLPPDIRAQYRDRLAARFPQLTIDVADHHSNVDPFISAADVLITFGPMMADSVLANAKNLKWVQALGSGIDGIVDQPSLRPDVVVTNIHGIQRAPVSEAALAAMLSLSRDIPHVVHNQDKRVWARRPARLLHGKTIGILGIGAIAEALAPKCKAMDMTVIGISSAKRAVAGFDRVHGRDELRSVAGELDYLVLLTPYSPQTHHLVDATIFAAMKRSSYLINLARGGVMDEAALVAALQNKQIAGAALDVFNQEPLPPEHPFWDMENVIVTPHLGGFCDIYVDLALPVIAHNMECFLRGDFDAMRNVVRR